MASAPQARLNSLQVGRGLAAVAVLLHHAEQSVVRFSGKLPAVISVPFSYGYLGVDFFFVLSGFIIYYVSHHRVAQHGWPRSYAESRVTRVFLPYLPLGIAVAIAYGMLPSMASGENDWNWFSTLTLLPSQNGPALSPAWTLQHEMMFYAAAFVCLYTRRVLIGCILGGLAAVGYDLFVGGSYKSFSVIDLEFVFGIFAAWCFVHNRLNANLVLVAVGLAASAAYFVLNDRNLSVIFGLGVACILLPVVRAEAAGRLRAGPALIVLGDASYAIYLLHHPLVSVLVRLLKSYPAGIALPTTVVVPLVAGLLYHRIFELPVLSLSRTWLNRRNLKSSLCEEAPVAP